jgi:hypothetical protein
VGGVSTADPRVVWDALAAGGWSPRGRLVDYYSRCPEHDGDGRSLHVSLMPSGVINLHCFAYGCRAEDIVARLGLRMADLFPTEGRYTSTRLPTARREEFTGNAREAANVLLAAERVGLLREVSILLDECPNCEWPHARLVVPCAGEPFLHCQRGCSVEAFKGGLAERLNEWRRVA